MLPNFFIVGAAKCGTSSLDHYLSQHPQIFIPQKKEAHYFSTPSFPAEFRGPGDEGMNMYTIRQRDSYCQLFDDAKSYKAVGESSVFYLYYPGTAERIRYEIPHAKIIILLRNPVERALSAYTHLIRDGREHLIFEQSLEREDTRRNADFEPMWFYKELGLYSKQVRRYLETFGREQVKVILFEEFIKNTQHILTEVFHFLNVNRDVKIDTSLKFNESGKPKLRWVYDFVSKPNPLKELVKPFLPMAVRERLGVRAKSLLLEKVMMQPETRTQLEKYFSDDIAQLENLLQTDLSIWHGLPTRVQSYAESTCDVG